MIRELHIENFVVIERATVLFESGVTAITGASGAGKSVLLSALSLACGARSEADVVRTGCDEARVDLRIEMRDADGLVSEHVLSRVIPREGRSRAYVDGRPSTAHALAEIAGASVDIHGQHEQHKLGSTRVRSDLLDGFGGLAREIVDHCAGEVAAVKAEMLALGGSAAERERELDYLEYQLQEIDSVSPSDRELDDLISEELLLSDVDKIHNLANQALATLANDEHLRTLMRDFQQIETFTELARRLDGVLAELDDVSRSVRDMVSTIDDDPTRLTRVRERISELRALCRKYGETLPDVLSFRDNLVREIERLRQHDERYQSLESSLKTAEAEYATAAADLKGQRREWAPQLSEAVTDHLSSLGMPFARFDTRVEGIDGGDVDFVFAPNGTDEMRTLGKIASGGETARCMLALDLAIGHRHSTGCVMFDEIDSGVDASAGDSIAAAIREASVSRQILVVTHLATVAASADTHLVVTKEHRSEHPIATLSYVDGPAREHEIARMLTGSDDDQSVSVARRLLNQ